MTLTQSILMVGGIDFPCLMKLKYLGIMLDRRLTRIPYIKYITMKASRAVNVLRVISRVSLGVSPSILLTIHRGLIRI